MEEREKRHHEDRFAQRPGQEVHHVGGVNDELGGVDPFIDDNLMSLSSGP